MTEGEHETAEVILIAEDDVLVRLVASDILSDAGYRVLEACDGQEALTVLEIHRHVRVLFTEIRMPNLDGLALVKLVKERWPAIAIVITSADSLPEDVGAIFVPKPYESETLLSAVQRAREAAAVHREI